MAAQATGAEARNAKRAMAVAPPRPAVRRRTYESRMRHERESENNEKARGVRGEGDSGWQQGLIPFLFVFLCCSLVAWFVAANRQHRGVGYDGKVMGHIWASHVSHASRRETSFLLIFCFVFC